MATLFIKPRSDGGRRVCHLKAESGGRTRELSLNAAGRATGTGAYIRDKASASTLARPGTWVSETRYTSLTAVSKAISAMTAFNPGECALALRRASSADRESPFRATRTPCPTNVEG